MQIANGTLVAIVDGAKMLFLRNEGDADYPNLSVERKREQDNPSTGEQKANRSGHVGQSGASGGDSYSDTDFHQLEEDRFAAQTADLLKARALRNDFDHLIVVAAPKTLGELRKHYHGEVERRLTGEIAKDLTGHEIDQIERIISAA